jgi:nitronate monooxygenase
MFLVSGPRLITETCRSGVAAAFPALNQRSTEGFEQWVVEIKEDLAAAEKSAPDAPIAPFGVNLIVHRSNPRLQADLEVCIKHRVPLIITSLGAVAELVDAVHGYGGVVFHDVINVRHARKAAEAGVDGLITVCAGAGGHAGTMSPFALVPEIRRFFSGTIVLAGCISHGRHIAAARMMGADLAYMGTRFINTREARVSPEYKQMIVDSAAKDIVYTDAISGVYGNFLRASIEAAGLDPDNLEPKKGVDFGSELQPPGENDAKAWKTVWSAGQGVGSIDDIMPAAELCQRLKAEYLDALEMNGRF